MTNVISGTTHTAWGKSRFHHKRGQTPILTGLALAVLFSVIVVLYYLYY